MNKQLLKTSRADVLSCRKKLGKTLRGGGGKNLMGGGIPPLARPRANIRKINIYIIVTVVVVIIYLLFLFDIVVLR